MATSPWSLSFIFQEGEKMKDKAYYDALATLIISCAYNVSRVLGSGFLEKVYENALVIELIDCGLNVETQKPIQVLYQDHIVGEYFADIIVDDDVVLELKAVKAIESIHFAQCQNYLKATGKKLGMVINFGEEKVKIRRVANGI
jgi:GxxExxY protein